jgi:hypothetical protein
VANLGCALARSEAHEIDRQVAHVEQKSSLVADAVEHLGRAASRRNSSCSTSRVSASFRVRFSENPKIA